MEKIYLIVLALFFFILQKYINKFFLKKKIFCNFTGLEHQTFTDKQLVPLSGGVLLIFSLSIVFYNENYLFLFLLYCIFLIGLIGDTNLQLTTKVRFFFQVIVVTIAVIFLDLKVENIRIYQIDQFLGIETFAIMFSIICFLILINGTNFIDGCNTLVLGYYILIFLFLFNLNILQITLSSISIKVILISFFILLFYNFFQKLYLGDSGAYLIAFLTGVIIVTIYKKNNYISPYFFANLLWYPCFEVFFSILRKVNLKFSFIEPDTRHLHQLLFYFLLNNKIFRKTKRFLLNSLTSVIINFVNFVIFFISSQNIFDTKLQISCLILSILIYFFSYLRLYNFRYSTKQ